MHLKSFLLAALSFVLLPAMAQTTQRNALVEDFSNAECTPCKTLSEELHPALVSIGSNAPDAHLNTITYQLNYPGYDPSYNLHARQRELFYQMNGLPALKVNGKAVNPMFNTLQYEQVLDTSRDRPAKFAIEGTYVLTELSHLLKIDFRIRPLVAIQGPYKVHTVVAERHYTNPESSIGMFEYHFVMRRMFPDGNGQAVTEWAANTPRQFSYEAPYQVSNPPASGSFDFWGNPLWSDVIVFIQDTVTKEVLQSQVIQPELPVSVMGQKKVSTMILYPNPASDVVLLAFDMQRNNEVLLTLADPGGRTLQTYTYTHLPPGRHEIRIATHTLTSGTYLLQLDIAGIRQARLFNIIR